MNYCANDLPVLSSVPADENPRTDMPVIMVHARRPREFKFAHHLLRAQGGVAFVPVCGAVAGAGAAAGTGANDLISLVISSS